MWILLTMYVYKFTFILGWRKGRGVAFWFVPCVEQSKRKKILVEVVILRYINSVTWINWKFMQNNASSIVVIYLWLTASPLDLRHSTSTLPEFSSNVSILRTVCVGERFAWSKLRIWEFIFQWILFFVANFNSFWINSSSRFI